MLEDDLLTAMKRENEQVRFSFMLQFFECDMVLLTQTVLGVEPMDVRLQYPWLLGVLS